MKPNDAAIRKRTQISNANRTMFLWIAGASALVGAALVVSLFLSQKLIYNEKVLAAKQDTVTTLEKNNQVVEGLAEEVRALDANTDLLSIKANPGDQALQVILDSLPSEANSLALGASLQNKLLAGIQGLDMQSLQVDPVVGIETLTGDEELLTTEPVEGEETNKVITFRFIVAGSYDNLKQVLQNLERSIRTIKVTALKIETQSSGPVMTVDAEAYYEPAKTIELELKAVPR